MLMEIDANVTKFTNKMLLLKIFAILTFVIGTTKSSRLDEKVDARKFEENYEWEAFRSLNDELVRKLSDNEANEEANLKALELPMFLKFIKVNQGPLAMWRQLHKANANSNTDIANESFCNRDLMNAFNYARRGLDVDLNRQEPIMRVTRFIKVHLDKVRSRCSAQLDESVAKFHTQSKWPESVQQLLSSLINEDVVAHYFEIHPHEAPVHVGLLTASTNSYREYEPRRNKDEVLNNFLKLMGETNIKLLNEDVASVEYFRHLIKPCSVYQFTLNPIMYDSLALAQFHPGHTEGFMDERSKLYQETILRHQICTELMKSREESVMYIQEKVRQNISQKHS